VTRSRAIDVALAAVLCLIGQLEAWLGPYDGRLLLAAFSLATTVPLAARRDRPLAVGLLVVGAFALGQGLQGDLTETASGTLPVLVATGTLAAYEPFRRAAWGGLAALLAVWASVAASPEPPTTSNFAYATLVVAVSWGVGRLLAHRHGQLLVSESRRVAEAAEAVRLERARIARELHDVVAHGVSVMVLQAGAADQVLDARPEKAHEVLHSIQANGRAALVELRRMLDLLREDSDPAAALQPPPGLADLPALVDSTTAAGLPTSLTVDVEQEVPAAVGLSVYRIVQESLTNALKHAGPAVAAVRVARSGDELLVEVSDTGHGDAHPDSGSGGHGLAGMRERVHIFGGTLEVAGGRGWTVAARLPLGGAS
jgi:signal transduction histidine kinase